MTNLAHGYGDCGLRRAMSSIYDKDDESSNVAYVELCHNIMSGK